MPVIKFDVSESDPEKAMSGGEPPRPGVYRCKIKEINDGLSKGEDGKPDPSRPRLEIVFQIVEEGPFKGSLLWDYISHMNPSQIWKMDQFLLALGVATLKKRKGQFKTEAQIGKVVRVLVKADTNNDGEYRAKVGRVMADEKDSEKESEADPDLDVEEVEEVEEAEEAEEAEDEFPEDEEEMYYSRESLSAMTNVELKKAAAEFDLAVKGMTRGKVIDAILEAQGVGDDGDDDIMED